MSDYNLAKKLRFAIKNDAPFEELLSIVDDILDASTSDSQCASYIKSAVDRAIRSFNTRALHGILQKCQDKNPNVLRSLLRGMNHRHPLLLILAVQTGNVDAVRILLEFGADPNGDAVQFHFLQSPLRVAAISPRSQLYCNTNANLDDSISSNESMSNSDRTVSYEIIRLLLEYGADTMKHSAGHSGTLPLHFAPHLAIDCPDAAALLLHSTPPAGYAIRFDWPPGSNSVGLTPLSMALFEANQTLRHGRNIMPLFTAIIIPLLQSGASLHPDPFSSSSTLNDVIYLDMTVGQSIFPQVSNAVLKIVLEARRQNGLAERDLKVWQSGPYANTLSIFPRRLDHLVRAAILSQLPLGKDNRDKAIDSLELPWTLCNFLKFSEFQC